MGSHGVVESNYRVCELATLVAADLSKSNKTTAVKFAHSMAEGVGNAAAAVPFSKAGS